MKSLEELKAIREQMQNKMNLREEQNAEYRVLVGMATCGIAAGARPVLSAFVEEIAKRNIENVMVTQTGCIGLCQYEPVVEVVTPQGKTTYVRMDTEKVAKVVVDHLVNGNIVTEYTIGHAVGVNA